MNSHYQKRVVHVGQPHSLIRTMFAECLSLKPMLPSRRNCFRVPWLVTETFAQHFNGVPPRRLFRPVNSVANVTRADQVQILVKSNVEIPHRSPRITLFAACSVVDDGRRRCKMVRSRPQRHLARRRDPATARLISRRSTKPPPPPPPPPPPAKGAGGKKPLGYEMLQRREGSLGGQVMASVFVAVGRR